MSQSSVSLLEVAEQIHLLQRDILTARAENSMLRVVTMSLFGIMASYTADPELKDKLQNAIFPMMRKVLEDTQLEGDAEGVAFVKNAELQALARFENDVMANIDYVRMHQKRTVN